MYLYLVLYNYLIFEFTYCIILKGNFLRDFFFFFEKQEQILKGRLESLN